MIINITSGDCLNKILNNKKELFIPFREALIKGTFKSTPFSNDFINERVISLNTTKEDYLEKMNPFLLFLNHLNNYEKVILWFGDEPFCLINRDFIIHELKRRNYQGTIILHIVSEEDGSIIRTEIIE